MISVRMPEELMNRLDRLAKSLERSRSYLAAQAIEEYVSIQEWQVKAIQEGIEDARAGRMVPHEVVVKELRAAAPALRNCLSSAYKIKAAYAKH
jgi:predicted transcriptional regulator